MAKREDLEKLFEAALKQPDLPQANNNKPSPVTSPGTNNQHTSSPTPTPTPSPAHVFQKGEAEPAPSLTPPKQDFGTLGEEFATLMEERELRLKLRHRRQALITSLVFFGSLAGGVGWVVSSPDRRAALKSAYADIKSVGDVNSIVARYQAALEKIKARGNTIDGATRSMGIDPTKVDSGKDPGFDTEMRDMIGPDGGPTTAERDVKLRERFESMKTKAK
jgi:hypothetical protein